MDYVSIGRALIGDSLAFHLLFIVFGVGLPVLISLLELYAILAKQPQMRQVAHTWARALVILFIAGAVSGTIISLQFSLLWPKFMAIAGKVVGPAFVLEGIMFTIEAIFLSVYMLSWDRFKPIWHWLCSLPVILGSSGSAFFITAVNAFMNTPRGFKLDAHGNPTDVNPVAAMFNPAAFHEISHSVMAYYFTTALVFLAIYAWFYFKRRSQAESFEWVPRLMTWLAAFAVIAGLSVAILGDHAGKQLAKYEPRKLAAAEALMNTQTNAPLIIGGVVTNNDIKYGIKIPSLLSFLATGKFNGQVKGLNDFATETRPPIIIHYFFDFMVAIGITATGIPLLFLTLKRFKPQWAFNKLVLFGLVACGVLAMLGVEFGWMLTEFGRQPYAIMDVLLVKDALSTSNYLLHLGYIFPTLFLILLGMTIFTLKKIIHIKEESPDEHL